MSDLNVSVIMRLVNRMKGPAREARGDLKRIENQTKGIEQQARRTGKAQAAMANAGRLAARGIMIGTAAVAVAAGNSVRQAVKMEDAWSDANKTLELSPVALAEMKSEIDAMATRIPVARDGLVEIVAAAGQIGIRGRADILAFTEDAAKMSETFDISAGQAGVMMSEWREQMKYSQDEVRLLADKINYLGNTTGATSAKLAAYTSNIIGIADAAGLTEDVTLAFGAAIIASGRAPEVAATGMRGLFRTMTKGVNDMSKAESDVLDRIGLTTQWDGIKDQMQTDASGAVMRVVEAISMLPEADRAAATTRLFGEEAHRALGTLLSDADMLRVALERVPSIAAAAGSMEAEYLALSDDVIDNWKRVRNALGARSESFGVTMLDPINESLKSVLGVLTTLDDRATIFDRMGASWRGFAAGFGGNAGTVIRDRLSEISTALGNFLFGVEGEDPGEVLARVFNNAKELGERAGAVRDAVVTAVEPIVENLDALRDAATAMLNGDFTALQAMLDRFLNWVENIEIPHIDLDGLLPAEIANFQLIQDRLGALQGLVDMLRGIATYVKNTGAAFFGEWLEAFSSSVEPTITRLSSIHDQLRPIMDNFGRIFTVIGEAFEGASESEGLTKWVAQLGKVSGALAGLGLEAAATVLEAMARSIAAFTGAVAAVLEGDFAGAAESLKGYLTWLSELTIGSINLGELIIWPDVPGWVSFMMGEKPPVKISDSAISKMENFDKLSSQQQHAAATLEFAKSKGDLPTADTIKRLERRVALGQQRVELLESKLATLPDGTGWKDQARRQPIKIDLSNATRDLDVAKGRLDEAKSSSDELVKSMNVVNGTNVDVAVTTTSLDQAISKSQRLLDNVKQIGAVTANVANVNAAPKVQARASGGAFGPGWLLTGERGPELEYRNRGGFIAHHAQLQEMVRNSDTIRRNVGRALPTGQIAQRAVASQGSSVTVGDIHIHAAPGMNPRDIARAVRRELASIKDARRGDLHDGEVA